MSMDRSRYPDDWEAISQHIRFTRAGGKCEQCGVAHGALILRSTVDAARYLRYDEQSGIHYTPDGAPVRLSELPDEFSESKYTRVVLTTAHVNHDTADNRDENLRAWCQLCHNRHDVPHRKANRKKTAAEKHEKALEAAGQKRLF